MRSDGDLRDRERERVANGQWKWLEAAAHGNDFTNQLQWRARDY